MFARSYFAKRYFAGRYFTLARIATVLTSAAAYVLGRVSRILVGGRVQAVVVDGRVQAINVGAKLMPGVYAPIEVHRKSAKTIQGRMVGSTLTGRTLAFTLRQTSYSGTAVVSKTPTIPTATTYSVALLSTDLDLAAGTYYYTVAIIDSGYEEVITFGEFEILAPRVP